MAMSPKAQAAYDEALRQAIVRYGQVVAERPDIYIWEDYDLTSHARQCPLSVTNTPQEDHWYEFEGTFADHSRRHGVKVAGINCACGEIKQREMRWQTSPSAMIEAVFEIVFSTE